MGALFVFLNSKLLAFRLKYVTPWKSVKVLEVLTLVLLSTIAFGLMPTGFSCQERFALPDQNPPPPLESYSVVGFQCAEVRPPNRPHRVTVVVMLAILLYFSDVAYVLSNSNEKKLPVRVQSHGHFVLQFSGLYSAPPLYYGGPSRVSSGGSLSVLCRVLLPDVCHNGKCCPFRPLGPHAHHW